MALSSSSDVETKDLEALLAAFSSMRTLEEIAYAYCKAGRDVTRAGDLLFQSQETNNHCSASNEEIGETAKFKEPCYEKQIKFSECQNEDSKWSKPWKTSASLGTVSGVLGNKYARVSSSGNVPNALRETVKPQKIELMESLLDSNGSKSVVLNSTPSNVGRTVEDIQEFLFSMLGEGFKLSKDVIQEVLGQCGYDMKQSMDELLKLSASTVDKNKAVCALNSDLANDNSSTMSTDLYKESSSHSISMERKYSRDKSNLANEVLQSLFKDKLEEEEPRKRFPMGLNRTRVVGQRAITKPLESYVYSSKEIPKKVDVKNDEEDEYHILRRAAKQHREAMKTYYEAAIDAFTRGDNQKANYFLAEGRYYNQKAREADEKSNVEIVEPSKKNADDEISLDLQDQNVKEAKHLLKLHLLSLSNIPSLRCLKVIIGADGGDRKQGKKRRVVINLLEKESINWLEDANDQGVLKIQLDKVDRSKLSFAKDI